MSTLRVKDPFAVDQGGFHRVLRAGDLIDENDPVVTPGRLQFFEQVAVTVAREQGRVESASAAPGERRTVTTPKPTRRRAAKKAAATVTTPKPTETPDES